MAATQVHFPPMTTTNNAGAYAAVIGPPEEREHIISMTNYAGRLLPIWQAIKDIAAWLWIAFLLSMRNWNFMLTCYILIGMLPPVQRVK